MAEKKSSQTWLFILLGVVVAYFVYEQFTAENSLLNLKATKKIFKMDNKDKVEFDLKNFDTIQAEFHKYKRISQKNQVEGNPFYKPVKKVKRVYKPLLVVDVTEIYEGDTPYAEIGGELMTVGDEYKGWKIIEIQPNRVRFQKGQNKVYIPKKPKKQ